MGRDALRWSSRGLLSQTERVPSLFECLPAAKHEVGVRQHPVGAVRRGRANPVVSRHQLVTWAAAVHMRRKKG
jgi:hypothetical protein